MEDKDRVSILLAEYNTLRAEVLAARTLTTQAIAIGAPFFLGLIGLSVATSWHSWTIVTVGLGILITIAGVAIWNEANTRSFTRRLRDIERAVNECAGQRLLVWETDYGSGSLFSPRSNYPNWTPQSK